MPHNFHYLFCNLISIFSLYVLFFVMLNKDILRPKNAATKFTVII